MSNEGTRLLFQLSQLLLQAQQRAAEQPPPALDRYEKKQAGLKYCRYAGYGHRWKYGRRVRDEHEFATILKIADLRQQGHSWYGIAARLLRERVRTKEGREWSPNRVRRAYLALASNGGPPESTI